MPVTVLDSSCALIVIDLQKGIVALPTVHPIAGVVERAAALAAAFRAKAKPVVLVTVAGRPPGRSQAQIRTGPIPPDATTLVPELNQHPSDLLVVKHAWGAFSGTDLESRLRALRVTQVVIAGVATSIGVESTARQAFDLGYNVTLALDAMTDLKLEAHDNSVERIFPRLGEIGSTSEILKRLAAAGA